MQRRTFLKTTSWAAANALAPWPSDPVIGHSSFQYKVDRFWCLADPGKYPVNNCHELVMDRRGNIYMTTDDTRNNILIFNKDGQITGAWGHEYPGAHGLTLHDENGTEFLYIADYERHQVIKTTLSGQVMRTFDWPAESGVYRDAAEFKPTETAIAPNGDVVVADGYGKDYLVRYAPDGRLKGIFGGPDQLKNAHGIALDQRDTANPVWLVSSRASNQLKRFSLEGELLNAIDLPGAYICRPVVSGQQVYFAVLISRLPWDSQSGFICILDQQNKVVSAPGARTPRYLAQDGVPEMFYQTVRVFAHPHDVLVDPLYGDVYVSQWNSGKVYPYRLKRV